MLSQREQQIWDEIERIYEAEVEEALRVHLEPAAQRHRRVDDIEDVPATVIAGVAAVVVGFWATVFLVLIGALWAAVAVGLATALGWRLWRFSWLVRGPNRETPWVVTPRRQLGHRCEAG